MNIQPKYFCATFFNVGNGDSILIEWETDNCRKFGLIDCYDSYDDNERPVFNYLRDLWLKYRGDGDIPDVNPFFEFVLMTHAHLDHYSGLLRIMRIMGTKQFLFSECWLSPLVTELLYCLNYEAVKHGPSGTSFCREVKNIKLDNKLSFEGLNILKIWPDEHTSYRNSDPENENSIVLKIVVANTVFLLTADVPAYRQDDIKLCEGDRHYIYKVPHHGTKSGTFSFETRAPWADSIARKTASKKYAVHSIISSLRGKGEHVNSNVTEILSKMGTVRVTGDYSTPVILSLEKSSRI